jgi:hypothetical protein
MIKRMKKRGEGDPNKFVTGLIYIGVFLVLLLVVLFGVFGWGRKNIPTVTPGDITIAITACDNQVQLGHPSDFCNAFKSSGDNSFVTCSELTKNPSHYGAVLTQIQESSYRSFNEQFCKEDAMKKAIATECTRRFKDITAELNKHWVNSKKCSDWVTEAKSASGSLPEGFDKSNFNCNEVYTEAADSTTLKGITDGASIDREGQWKDSVEDCEEVGGISWGRGFKDDSANDGKICCGVKS